MSDTPPTLQGDDFAQGIALARIADGAMLQGHAHGEAVLLARRGDEVFAVGATCTHYGAPLAEQAGLAIDHGVVVAEYVETSVPGIFAAGDIARWPDALTGERLRFEHWVVAGRQGQTAARNLLGQRQRYAAVPFFWTEQYDFSLAYVGHTERFEEALIDGDLGAHDCTITYRRAGQKLAVAVVHRNLAGLHAEVDLERALTERSAAALAKAQP